MSYLDKTQSDGMDSYCHLSCQPILMFISTYLKQPATYDAGDSQHSSVFFSQFVNFNSESSSQNLISGVSCFNVLNKHLQKTLSVEGKCVYLS